MKSILDEKRINRLPIHDAMLLSFVFKQSATGGTCLIFDISITDNSYECGFAIPKNRGLTKLVFYNCRWFKNEFFCDAKNRDSFFSLELKKKSKKINELQSRGMQFNSFHYELKFNSGSKFSIVAEQVYLES